MNIPNEILINLWIAFMLILGGGLMAAIRHLLRRERIARGVRP
ncbi:hypothetical protein [Pseudomonas brassicacearum]|nr:hypothetical protein [Pseudomonas brassicacearum]